MADLYLPANHSPEDLDMAAQVVLALDRQSLVVCWSLARADYFDRTPPDDA
jgi:hypothetical protein